MFQKRFTAFSGPIHIRESTTPQKDIPMIRLCPEKECNLFVRQKTHALKCTTQDGRGVEHLSDTRKAAVGGDTAKLGLTWQLENREDGSSLG